MSNAYQGYIDRITYHNPENGFTIARLVTEPGGEPLTIVGAIAALKEGETVQVLGSWVSHARYGRQFRVDEVKPVRPGTLEGVERYLGSGLIKGVGPVSARRIVAHWVLGTSAASLIVAGGGSFGLPAARGAVLAISLGLAALALWYRASPLRLERALFRAMNIHMAAVLLLICLDGLLR